MGLNVAMWLLLGGSAAASLLVGAAHADDTHAITIIVDGAGYTPSRLDAKAGASLTLRFDQRSHSPCVREVVFPSLGIRAELPPGRITEVKLPPLPAGEIEFHCGMKMIKGRITATP